MNEPITFTVANLWTIILALCSGIAIIAVAITWVAKAVGGYGKEVK